jgi:hypothetical protein
MVRDGINATYYSIRQGPISGDAIALHSMPQKTDRLFGVELLRGPAGRLQWVAARYAFPGDQRGARLAFAEHKLLTAGGFYDHIADYAQFVAEAAAARYGQHAAYDYSISYDYGVVVNAFSKCFASYQTDGLGTLTDVDQDEIKHLVDSNLTTYCKYYIDNHNTQPNAIFSRELAFVILAVTTMYRITGEEGYLQLLRRLCEVLLTLEFRFDAIHKSPASGFLMRMDSPRVAFVDCHSAALLALTQAARYLKDPRLAAVIDRGLVSYCLETCRYDVGIVDTVATLMVDHDGVRRTENAFWNFKVGLTLRFFAALRGTTDPELRKVAARHRERMGLLEQIMRHQLERSVTIRDDLVELCCSPLSNETNSETQPWIMLGLMGHPYD